MKDQPAKAIDVYLNIIDALEGTPDMDHELAVYNKVGDLYLKTREVNSAVEMYERAAHRYVESGLPNNAIALCNKILRNAPGRTTTYLMLGELMLQRGFGSEAKQHFLEYAQRMKKAGQVQEAFKALKRFADASPQNDEVRGMLTEQLEAAIQENPDDAGLKKLFEVFTGRASTVTAVVTEDQAAAAASDLVFIDLDADGRGDTGESAVDAGSSEIESTVVADEEPETEVIDEGSLEIERPLEAEDDIDKAVLAGIVELDPSPDLETPDVEPLATDRVQLDEVPVLDEVPGLEDLSAHADSVAELDDVESLVEDVPSPGGERTSEPLAPGEVVFVTENPTDTKGSAELPELDVPELDLAGFDESGAIVTNSDEATADVGGDPLAPPEGKKGDEKLQEYLRGTGAYVLDGVPNTTDATVEKFDTFPALDDDTEIPELPAEPERTLEVLEAAVAQNPADPAARRELAEMLLEQGERDRGLDELDVALETYEKLSDWDAATSIATEILRLEPNSVPHLQKQVEFAYRRGDESQLVPAYLDLADALFSSGSMVESRAVYERVLELDSGNQAANEGIATIDQMVPPTEAAAGQEAATTTADPTLEEPSEQPSTPAAAQPAGRTSGFVDLGDFILGDEDQKSTRMIGTDAQSGDEQRDFGVMLSQFKKGIEENIDEADAQAHYDLGVAFKEMGLLEEAISEFQKALRAEDTRLRAAEALGLCFYEKGQLQVAATVMRRAVDVDRSGDEAKIGLLYWLGRCEEEQSKTADALTYYQRVFALDIKFQDVGDRVSALWKAGG